MSENKEYKTEWSFSFDKIGQSINEMFGSLSGDEEAQMASFSEPVNGATQARIDIDFSLGEATVQSLVGSDNLIEADVTYIGEMEFKSTGETDRVVKMRQKSGKLGGAVKRVFSTFAHRDDLRWDVRLSPEVPLDLDLDAGVGVVNVDLTGVQLRSLEYDGGVGKSTLTLPTGDTDYKVEIDGGVGEVIVNLPAETATHIKLDGGVGSIKMHIPANAAVRFNVEGGLGAVHMPNTLTRISGKDEFVSKSGVWETPDFASAEKQIVVDYKGGVGSLHVTSDVTMV